MDFRGFDSSIILSLMGGIPRPMGNFPESLSQAILVGIILVGRLGIISVLREVREVEGLAPGEGLAAGGPIKNNIIIIIITIIMIIVSIVINSYDNDKS